MPGPSPSCCPLRCDRSRSAAGRSPASASFAWGRSVRTGHRAGLACAARTPPIASPSSGTARRGQKPGSIPRRDSGSAVNVLAGGRLFPGRHHHASFDVHETPRDLHVAYTSRDGATSVQVDVSLAEQFQGSELFADLHEASAFFRHGSSGYSAGRDRGHLDGMELHTDSWRVQPVEAHVVRSTFFDDEDRFPPGSATLDCALLMRDVPVTWNPLRPMLIHRASGTAGARPSVGPGTCRLSI